MEGRDSPLCMVSLGLGCHIVQSHQSMVQPWTWSSRVAVKKNHHPSFPSVQTSSRRHWAFYQLVAVWSICWHLTSLKCWRSPFTSGCGRAGLSGDCRPCCHGFQPASPHLLGTPGSCLLLAPSLHHSTPLQLPCMSSCCSSLLAFYVVPIYLPFSSTAYITWCPNQTALELGQVLKTTQARISAQGIHCLGYALTLGCRAGSHSWLSQLLLCSSVFFF